MRKRFAKACKKRFIPFSWNSRLSYHLERTTRLGDLILGGRAECMGVNGELGFELAIAENFDGIGDAADETMRTQQIRSYRFAFGKHIEFLEIDHGIADTERIVKAALRNAAMQRHLSAFKTTAARITAARLLSLVAGPGGFAQLGTHAAAHANFLFARAF